MSLSVVKQKHETFSDSPHCSLITVVKLVCGVQTVGPQQPASIHWTVSHVLQKGL